MKGRIEHDIWCWYCSLEATWRRFFPNRHKQPQQTTILPTIIDCLTTLEWHNLRSSPALTWYKWLVTSVSPIVFLDFWSSSAWAWVCDWITKRDCWHLQNLLNREPYEFLSTLLFFRICSVSIFCHDSVGPVIWRKGEWFPVFKEGEKVHFMVL